MPESPTFLVQLPFDLGTKRAGLNAGNPRHIVNFKDMAHAAHVDREDRTPFVAWCLKTSGNIGPPAERNHNRIHRQSNSYDTCDFVLRTGIENEVRNTPHVAAPNPHQIPQALPVRMHDAFEHIFLEIVEAYNSAQ
jgi:hypothetical protein